MRQKMLDFLSGIEQNNNREWFHSHKLEYQEATEEFEQLIQELMLRLGKAEPDILNFKPRDLTFKLVRDTRFSNDKSPYLPAFRCHISGAGKLPVPVGYYLYICPGDRSFLGGGLFADMFKDATSLMRDHLLSHQTEFLELIEDSAFGKCFKLQGTALKNVPRGYPADTPVSEYLKYKSWYIEDILCDSRLTDDSFAEYAAERFLLMKPWNDFMNRALEGFVMPAR